MYLSAPPLRIRLDAALDEAPMPLLAPPSGQGIDFQRSAVDGNAAGEAVLRTQQALLGGAGL